MEFETERLEVSSGIRGVGLDHDPMVYLDYYILPKIESSYEPHKSIVISVKIIKLSFTIRFKYAYERRSR